MFRVDNYQNVLYLNLLVAKLMFEWNNRNLAYPLDTLRTGSKVQRSNAALCLLLALLTQPAFAHEADRLKVQVIQTHTGVSFEVPPSAMAFGDMVTRCNGTLGSYSKEIGYHCCKTGSHQERETSQERRPSSFFYDVSVILPDDAHLLLHCSNVLGKHCGSFPSYPENTSVTCSDFATDKAAYQDCTASGNTSEGIGVYEAVLDGDKVTIFGASWKRVYLKYGTWQDAGAPQNAAATQETKITPKAPPPAADGSTIDPKLMEQAKAGDEVAQYKLGYDYYLGRGIAQDYAQAAIWWRSAAEQGYADAQNNLGVLYNSGKGVPQSYSEAYFWENLAAARANGARQVQFAKNRDDSATKLSFFERLRVQKRAAKWFAAHPVQPKTTP
jgi:hypothetical protein